MRLLAAAVACLATMLVVPAGADTATASGTAALRVLTLDRHGRSVPGRVDIADLAGGWSYQLVGGRFTSVRRGTYEVLAAITDDRDFSETLGSVVVTVSGRTTATIDARRGHRVAATLRPAPPLGYDQFLTAEVCAPNATMIDNAKAGSLYAIPTRRASEEFALSSAWQPTLPAPGRPAFLGASFHRGGIPGTVSPAYAQSSLTTITVSGRSGPDAGDVALTAMAPDSQLPCRSDVLTLRTNPTLPYTVTLRVPPGHWELWQDGANHVFGPPRDYRTGRAYRATVGASAWGPDGSLPYTERYSHSLVFQTLTMFADPYVPYGGQARVQYRLTHGGRTLVHHTYGPASITFPARLPGAGWYTLTAQATRLTDPGRPAGALSVHSTVRLHFYADPSRTTQVRDFIARFRPASLDATNHTAARATTVWVYPQRTRSSEPDARTLPDGIHRLRVWMSGDGRNWRAVRAVRVGGRWRADVPNPASGYVSLRATIDDTHGGSAQTTVYRAYAVG